MVCFWYYLLGYFVSTLMVHPIFRRAEAVKQRWGGRSGCVGCVLYENYSLHPVSGVYRWRGPGRPRVRWWGLVRPLTAREAG